MADGAIDRPVETGHELVLATLLVHFGVDETEQLPVPLRRVVEDVYEIAADLADSKVASQCEALQLRKELAVVRAELDTIQRASSRIDRTREAAPAARTEQRESAATATERATATPISATTAKLRSNAGDEIDETRMAASTNKLSISATARRRVVFPVAPWQQKARELGWNSSTRVIPNGKGKSPPLTDPHRRWASAPAAMAAPGARGHRSAQVSPLPAAATVSATVRECFQHQLATERRLHVLLRQLYQAVQWRVVCRSDGLVVVVGGARAHSIGAIRFGLDQVDAEVDALRTVCSDSLQRVVDISHHKAWFKARADKLGQMLRQVQQWTTALASATDKFGCPVASASETIWSDIRIAKSSPVDSDFYAMYLRQEMPSPFKPLSVVFVDYAIVSFGMQVLETFAAHCLPRNDFDSLTTLGKVARELEGFLHQFEDTAQAFDGDGDGFARVLLWADAITFRHGRALRCIQQRAVACSETLCGVHTRLCTSSTAPLPRTTHTQTPSSFPGDIFTWSMYQEIVLGIVSSHVVLTRFAEIPESSRTAAKRHLTNHLAAFVACMAPWADPRFAANTSARQYEQAEYLKLMDWCDVLHEIVASYGEETT
jgi:hypothetical protein